MSKKADAKKGPGFLKIFLVQGVFIVGGVVLGFAIAREHGPGLLSFIPFPIAYIAYRWFTESWRREAEDQENED